MKLVRNIRCAGIVTGVALGPSADGQSPIRLIEDARYVSYAIDGGGSASVTPDPAFDDNYLGISGQFHDDAGRIAGYSTQITERLENQLRCDSRTQTFGEGLPARRTTEQESHWTLRFETREPCAIRITGELNLIILGTNASVPLAGEARVTFRRGSAAAPVLNLAANTGNTYRSVNREFALVARPGEQFELDVHTYLRSRVNGHSFDTTAVAELSFVFTPFVSTWTEWPIEQGGNGHWYRVVRTGVGTDWEDADLFSTRRGGHLCTISSANENEFVFGLINNSDDWRLTNQYANGPWLGGLQADGATEPAGGWHWVTAEPFTFTHWAAGEPNNSGGDERYLNFYCQAPCVRGSTWNDHDSVTGDPFFGSEFRPIAFVVEYDDLPCPDSNDDGEVDLADLATLLANFGATGGEPFTAGDMSGDGDVTLDDLSLLLGHFGTACV